MSARRALDALYDGAAYVAALFMIGTLVMVLVGILERYVDFHLAGTDSYAGYCMAAAGFLALAHTFKRGEHIRVTLLLSALSGSTRRAFEIWALVAGTVLAALFACYSVRLAYQSWDFHDVSTGNDATSLWIPQIAMALGTIVLLVALVDELVLELRGKRRVRVPTELARSE